MRIERLTKPGDLKRWLEDTFKEGELYVSLDLETTGLTRNDRIISGAVTGPGDWVGFFGSNLLSELLEAPPPLEFVFHNASFDLKMLAWNGVSLHDKYKYHDTMVLAHLLNENRELSFGFLVKEYYDDDYKVEFWGKYKKAEDAPEAELIQYNANDVSYTLRLYQLFNEKLLPDTLSSDVIPSTLVSHVYALQSSLLATEIAGVAVDRDYLMQKGIELRTRIAELLPKMRGMVSAEIELVETEDWLKELEKRKTPKGRAAVQKPEFSFDSSKQLMRLLYDKLKLPEQKNDKTKQPTCDWDALEKLKDKHELIPAIQEYRELSKIYGTYIEGTLERVVDGRIYPSFNICGTATGRISHSNPNMGNLPRSGGIRGMFIPDPGHVFISADFSQLEVCLSAHFTQDTNLLKIVNDGASQHDITAAALTVDRNTAKTLNFAMQYGCSAFKVAKVLGVNEAEGKKAYDKYWETYSGQKHVMDECAKKVDEGRPIISPYGRRRRFEKCKRPPWDSAYRQAWNALIQGTGSDCTSRAFYEADKKLREGGFGRGLFTVHDEIICQVKEEHAEEAQKILIETMQNVGKEINLTVQLKAEGSGPQKRWED